MLLQVCCPLRTRLDPKPSQCRWPPCCQHLPSQGTGQEDSSAPRHSPEYKLYRVPPSSHWLDLHSSLRVTTAILSPLYRQGAPWYIRHRLL